ncbi:hypothetical protein GALL_404330 [mine drainage metagenome]|uniref:Uncharacterized protein n=1 Tax=mine drainage metagenome TaxID=410659 RepID=A0A1J5QK40_9ZZZZ
MRQFIDHGFDHESGMRMSHGSPPLHRNRVLRTVQTDFYIGDGIRGRHRALDRGGVDAVMRHERLKRRIGDDGLADDGMAPGCRLAVRADGGLDQVGPHRPVIAAAHVVFARPHHLDRLADSFRHLHRLDNEVGSRVGAPAETAAEIGGMDFHLLGLETGSLRGHRMVQGLRLGAGPDGALVGLEIDHHIQRLHRGMRQIGHFVFRAHRLAGALQ